MELSDTLLLSTKLKMPAPRRNYIVRKALFEKLSRCGDMGVIFVRGGAGTGKTTLLSSFIRETGLKNVGWMSIDASNANVYAFWLYFAAAVGAILGESSLVELVRANPDASRMENLLILLINRLCGDEDYYLVLDDVHWVRDESLKKTLEFFIGSMPDNFHLFLLSREDPPLYLGPLAVSGRLLFVDSGQLRLTDEEGMAFLKQTLCLAAGDDELTRLNGYAEGWIGGLQLAAAAGAGRLLQSDGGIAADYLTREIFESLSQREQDFLVATGTLSYFDADICAGVLDGFSRQDFSAMMDGLIRKNLFVTCIDEQNSVYRYHNILAEYLSGRFAELPEEDREALLIRAARAFEKRADAVEALRAYCAALAFDDVMRVAKAMGGRIEAWCYLDQVPVDRLIDDADLAAQCFLYNLGNANIDRCRVLFDRFRERYGDSDIFHLVRFAEAYVTKEEGVLPRYQVLPAGQIDRLDIGSVAKGMLLVENSAAYIGQMQYGEAERCIRQAIRTCAGANVFVEFYAYNQLAQVYEETGRLNDSLACYDRSRAMLKSPLLQAGLGANFYFGIAGVYLLRMELDSAAEALGAAGKLLDAQHIHMDVADMTLLFHLAEMKLLGGDADGGAADVDALLAAYPSFSVLALSRLIHELNCAGRLPTGLADRFLAALEGEESYRDQPFMRLIQARILLQKGESGQAFAIADDIQTFSRLRHNRLRLIEAGLLKLCILADGEAGQSGRRERLNLLREALHYARENRILAPFYLDRTTLLPLLRELSEQSGKNALTAQEAEFLRDVMAVCGDSAPAAGEGELLSARELEVLCELSRGITNREIAETLCISQATVKTHVLSIFGKLGVSSRMMAVELGRKKGLIS